MDPIYILLVLLRIILVFIPQYGYIHPDEFFQTTEVLTGDIFDVEVNKPWEYTVLPIRSISLIYIMFGLPLKLLKVMGEFYPNLISPYWILVVPRLVAAILSLVVDVVLYKLCRCFELNGNLGIRLMASSYIIMTYMTRPFTNFIEAFMLAVLLQIVFSDDTVRMYFASKFESADDEKTKVLERTSMKSYRLKSMYQESLGKTYYVKAILIGLIGTAGLFNRPTFAFMAIFPALMYCEAKQEKIYLHSAFVGIGAMISFIILTAVDTLYFGENFHELLNSCDPEKTSMCVCYLTSLLKWIVITPYNFLLYNMNPNHLAEHGLHPRYLHFLVNLNLLFGPLALLIYLKLLNLFIMVWKKKAFHKSYFPLVMTFIPILLISSFPHQEPRFLIPVLPLAVMTGVEQIQGTTRFKRAFVFLWILFNAILTFVYGFLHQGGVVQNLLDINGKLQAANTVFNANDQFVFYRTYMPPHSLLLSKTAKSQIVDVQGGEIDYFLRYLPLKLSENKEFEKHKDSNIYVITPSAVVSQLKDKNVSFEAVSKYSGHLSMENPPNLAVTYGSSKNQESIMNIALTFIKLLTEEMSLDMIKVPYDQLYKSEYIKN